MVLSTTSKLVIPSAIFRTLTTLPIFIPTYQVIHISQMAQINTFESGLILPPPTIYKVASLPEFSFNHPS